MSAHLPAFSNEEFASCRTPQFNAGGALHRPRMDGRRLICIVGALLLGCLPFASGFAPPAAIAGLARVRTQTQLNGHLAPRHPRGALHRRSTPLAMKLTSGAASNGPTRARGAGSISYVARRISAFLAVLTTAVLLAGARPAMASSWTSSVRHDAPSSSSFAPNVAAEREMVDPRIQTPSQATNAGSGDESSVFVATASAAAAAGFQRVTRGELMAMQPKLLVQRAPGYSFGSAAFRMAIKYVMGILMSFSTVKLSVSTVKQFFRRKDHY